MFALPELENPLCIECSCSEPVLCDTGTYLAHKLQSHSYRKGKQEQKENSQYCYFTPFSTLEKQLFLLSDGPVLGVKKNACLCPASISFTSPGLFPVPIQTPLQVI